VYKFITVQHHNDARRCIMLKAVLNNGTRNSGRVISQGQRVRDSVTSSNSIYGSVIRQMCHTISGRALGK